MKRCPRCKEMKPLDVFTARHSLCKPCKAAYELGRRRKLAGVIRSEDIARFWSRVDKNGPAFGDRGPCWVWQGAPRNHEGYGQFHIAGRNLSPHTVMFMLTRGISGSREIFVDHECRNRMCLNPDHLRFATPKQNALENNDSPHAHNAAKTSCIRGHDFTPENIYRTKRGHRNCIACMHLRREGRI